MKKTILFISHSPDVGGAEMFMLRFWRNINKEKFRIIVALPQTGRFSQKLEEFGIKTVIIKIGPFQRKNPLPIFYSVKNIFDLIKKEKVDLLHAATRPAQYYCAWAAKLAKIPNVCHFFDAIDWKDYMKFSNWSVRMADKVIAVSDASKRCLLEGKIKENDILLVYNGIDLLEFEKEFNVQDYRNEFGMDNAGKLVGIAGRLVKEKGFSLFLESAGLVAKEYPEVKFIIVGDEPRGDGNYTYELKELIRGLRLESKVILTGFRSDVLDIISAMDVLVLASNFSDPFPTVLLEAMALGKAVVATDVGGVREIVDDGLTGLVVENENKEQLSKAISSLISDQKKAEKLGQAAKQKIRSKFIIDTEVLQIEGCYESLIAK